MPDNPRRAKGGGWAVLATVLVLLPVGYVASIGPVYRSLDTQHATDIDALHATEKKLRQFYGPIRWACYRWPIVNYYVQRYCGAEEECADYQYRRALFENSRR
jgi:hypothetical protein